MANENPRYTDAEFRKIHELAHQYGHAAATGVTPTPMIVGEAKSLFGKEIDYSKPTYYVSEGACGFAWISFKGTTAWARWAKKNLKVGKDYPTGLMIWVSDYGQSIDRKEAYAAAYAKVLREAGIDAYPRSRLD